MSSQPSAKRRKLNNGSSANINNKPKITFDYNGILSLAEALSMERQCFISLLKYRANINLSTLIEWILKIQEEQTSIVKSLKQCFEIGLNSITSLKEINQKLNKERTTLMNILNGDIINNINNNPTMNTIINNNECYKLMSKRIIIIHNLINENKQCTDTIIESKNDNNDTNDDIDIEIIHSNENKSKKCPLTQCKMIYPKKSMKCNHTFEFFAIVDYILNKQTNIYYFSEIECPACKNKISINDLITDYYMIQLLQNANSKNGENDNRNVKKGEMVNLSEEQDEKSVLNTANTEIVDENVNKNKPKGNIVHVSNDNAHELTKQIKLPATLPPPLEDV